MGKRLAVKLEEDDDLSEPDYDQLSDEELDELYNFGELRSPPKRRAPVAKTKIKLAEIKYLEEENEDWLDDDLEDDEAMYDN